MRRIALIALMFLAASCGVCKKPQRPPQKDSVVVYVRDSINIIDKVVERDSVVYIELPRESSQNILPTFVPSHLETSLAKSDAYVDSLGLHHTLTNKSTSLPATVPVTEHTVITDHTHQADSVATQTTHEEVEREFTKWEKFRMDAFWWLIGGLAAALIWIFRKQIIKLLV